MALPNFTFGERGIFPFIKAFQYLRNAYVSSSYPTGSVKPPIDYSFDNNLPLYADKNDGSTALQVGILADANNITQWTNPHGISAEGMQILALATPGAPTITSLGTVGSTTYTYVIVAKNGQGSTLGFSAASSSASTTTGNATLSVTNYNQISLPIVAGAKAYDIYRTVGGSTQGRIGTVPTLLNTLGTVQNAVIGSGVPISVSLAGNGAASVVGTLLFNDTGLAGDGTTAPTVNSSGVMQAPIHGDITVVALTTPVNVVATPQGTVGTTTITYKITALSQNGHTAASSAGTTTTGNATLTAVNSVLVTWNAVPGAISYNVYRTAAGGTPSTTGLIGNVLSLSEGTSLSFNDTGIAGDSSTAPTSNTTGGISSAGPVTGPGGTNYIASETGANNALVATGPTLVVGMTITLQLAHSAQAGANTLNLNGLGAVAIKSHFNPANNLATAYAATGVIQLFWNGTAFLDLSQ